MGEKETILLDPSSLTTQMVFREVSSLKELTFNRLESIQKASDLFHDDLVRVPTDVQKQVAALKELVFLKLRNIDEMFALVERQRLEQKQDTALSVEKAFNSAKEAVKEQNNSNNIAITKSEMYVNAQLNAINGVINDLKERITKTEGITAGISVTKTEQKTSIGLVIAIIFGITATVSSIIGIMISLNK